MMSQILSACGTILRLYVISQVIEDVPMRMIYSRVLHTVETVRYSKMMSLYDGEWPPWLECGDPWLEKAKELSNQDIM